MLQLAIVLLRRIRWKTHQAFATVITVISHLPLSRLERFKISIVSIDMFEFKTM